VARLNYAAGKLLSVSLLEHWLAGCDSRAASMSSRAWDAGHRAVESALLFFSESRLGRSRLRPRAHARGRFPSYFISDSMPLHPTTGRSRLVALSIGRQSSRSNQLKRCRKRECAFAIIASKAVGGRGNGTACNSARSRGWSARAATRSTSEFRSFDKGYYSTWDIESSLHPQTILAYGRTGARCIPITARQSGSTRRSSSAIRA